MVNLTILIGIHYIIGFEYSEKLINDLYLIFLFCKYEDLFSTKMIDSP